MIKQQRILIAVIAIAVLLMAVAYVAIVKPLTEKQPVVTTEPIVTVEGEIIGASDRFQLYEQVARADMQSIEIVNEHGSFAFDRADGDNFVIRGAESTLFSAERFSQLVVDTGFTLAKAKIADHAAADFDKYGLADAQSPAHFTVTTLTGRKHTVYIGNKITTGGGYYVRYEGRDTVYVLDTTLASTVLQPVESFVTPLLSYPTSLTTYFLIDDFTIFHGNEMFASFTYLDDNHRSPINTYSSFAMLYPGEGTYCPSGLLDTALQAFVDFEGSEVVRLEPSEEELNRYFESDVIPYTVHITNLVPLDQNDLKKGYNKIENYLIFSEKHIDRDGSAYYYCYSAGFRILAKVPSHKAEFLGWELKEWVSETIYQLQIDTVSTMRFAWGDKQVTFSLKGEGSDLVVTEKETGHKPIVKNFRQLYKMILTVNKESANGLSDEEITNLTADPGARQLRMTVTMRDGTVLDYEFYNYSDRRTYYTINGAKCDFYVLRTSVNKLIADVERVMNDETVNSEDKY